MYILNFELLYYIKNKSLHHLSYLKFNSFFNSLSYYQIMFGILPLHLSLDVSYMTLFFRKMFLLLQLFWAPEFGYKWISNPELYY